MDGLDWSSHLQFPQSLFRGFQLQFLLLLLLVLLFIYSLEFFTSTLADGLSLEFEWLQISRTLLRILAVLNNVVVWMVSTRPPTSKPSSPFSNPLDTVSNAPITISIIVTGMFHSFFNSLTRSRYLSFIIIIIIIIIILLIWVFFTPALADGFPLESWEKASLLKSSGLFSVFWFNSTML